MFNFMSFDELLFLMLLFLFRLSSKQVKSRTSSLVNSKVIARVAQPTKKSNRQKKEAIKLMEGLITQLK